jgi:cold shock CspA family protein
MRKGRFFTTGAMLLAVLVSAQLRADVLDQVPSDAMVVLKVKNLDAISRKVAKFAKDLGLDQQDPAWADPLGALAEKSHMGKGVNRAGDLAVAVLDPAQFGGDNSKSIVVLVPTSNYKTFLANFKASSDVGGGVSKATAPEGSDEVFVANWGEYAAISPVQAVVAKKPSGMKLTGFSAKEAGDKDALVYVNMKAVREKVLPELKKGRENLMKLVDQGLAGQEKAKKYTPLVKAAVNQLVNVAEEFLNDAHGATVGLSLSDAGINATVAADFEPTSYLGKIALQTKGTTESLLNGLPDRKYFMFGGSSTQDPKLTQKLMADLLDPIIKEMGTLEDTKKFATALESMKKGYASLTGSSIGMVAPTGALGQESLLQQVAVFHGDAKAVQESQRQTMAAANDLMQLFQQMGPQANIKSSFELKPNSKTVAGVQFDVFQTKMNFPEDDPASQQAKQMLGFVYGPNGMTGVTGVIDPKTLVMVQGGSDELIADSVAAAKGNVDTLGAQAGVRAVAAQLPKERSGVFFLDVGTIVSTAARYAKGFGAPINVKVPADLPPIGFASGTDQTAIRVDVHVPNRLIQGLVSTYMEAQRQMKNPNGGL